MSGTGQQLPLFEFRSNYNQQISHDVPTQGGIWFNMTSVTNPHSTGSLRARFFIPCPVKEDGKMLRFDTVSYFSGGEKYPNC